MSRRLLLLRRLSRVRCVCVRRLMLSEMMLALIGR